VPFQQLPGELGNTAVCHFSRSAAYDADAERDCADPALLRWGFSHLMSGRRPRRRQDLAWRITTKVSRRNAERPWPQHAALDRTAIRAAGGAARFSTFAVLDLRCGGYARPAVSRRRGLL
jgi:hypothetical protein